MREFIAVLKKQAAYSLSIFLTVVATIIVSVTSLGATSFGLDPAVLRETLCTRLLDSFSEGHPLLYPKRIFPKLDDLDTGTLVGEGGYARVLRIAPVAEASYLVKVYHLTDPEGLTGHYNPIENLNREVEGLIALEEKLPKNDQNFGVVHVQEVLPDYKALKMSDVKGFDMDYVVNRIVGKESELGQELIKIYNERLDNAFRAFRDTNWSVEYEFRGNSKYPFHEYKFRRGTTMIILRPRNIILDLHTLAMVIVDPE